MKIFKIVVFSILLAHSALVQGQNWTDLGVKMNRAVGSFYHDTASDILFFGGGFAFYSVDGDTTYTVGIAAYNGDSIFPVGCGVDWDCVSHLTPSSGVGGVNSITKYNGEIICGGTFLKADGKPIERIARWNGSIWDSLGHGVNGPVKRVYVTNNELYVGGSFDSAGSIVANSLAKWNGSGWSDVGNFQNYNCCGSQNLIQAIQFFNDELYVGGRIADSLGNPVRIARYNGSVWRGVGNGFVGSTGSVYDMELFQGSLYVAGNFKKSDGNPGNSIARWDGNQWYDVGGGIAGTGGASQIYDLHIFNDELYASGVFSFAGGVPAHCIAKWDGQEWCGLGSTFDNVILGIGVYDNELYIGGGFWTIDGDSIIRLAKWIGGDYVDSCGNLIGIDDSQANNEYLKLYPNPATSAVVIETANQTNTFYSIYDITGRLLQTGSIIQKSSIDVSDFAGGVYVVQLQTGEGMVSRRFAKQ